MKRFRICPKTNFPCFKPLPAHIDSMKVDGKHACGYACAEAFARKDPQRWLATEYRISDGKTSEIIYQSGLKNKHGEAKE